MRTPSRLASKISSFVTGMYSSAVRMWIVTSWAPRRVATRAQSSAVKPAPTTATRRRTGLGFPAVQGHQEWQAMFDIRAGRRRALGRSGNAQRQRQWRHAAGGQQYRIVLLKQTRQRDIALAKPHALSAAQVHTQAQRVVQLDIEDIARQAKLRNAVAQHAAKMLLAFEHRHIVPEHRQVVGGGHAGRAGTHDGDALAGGRVEPLGDAVAGMLEIGRGTLEVADTHRSAIAGPAVATGVFAGTRTDPPEHARQHVGGAIDFICLAVPALGNGADVRRHVGAGGARRLARYVLPDPADVARILRMQPGHARSSLAVL